MFGRKKNRLIHTLDGSKTAANDFARLFPYESYRAADYKIYYKLTDQFMKPQIDAHLAALFKGTVDDGNGDMLDMLIFGAAREALPFLNNQRNDHIDLLRRLIARRRTDKDNFISLLENRKIELAQLECSHMKTCQAFEKEGGL